MFTPLTITSLGMTSCLIGNTAMIRCRYSSFEITVLAGGLPLKKHKLVVAWIEIYQEDLLADWALAVDGKQPFPIRGLDQ